DLPELCRIEGSISPTIGFLLRMPTADWNGKILMGGCGGPCGTYLEDKVDPALVRHYAVVTTDMGHKGPGWLFAYHNPQAQIDFAYRATHLTAVVAKQLIAEFYGRPAQRNYFLGCSTGGRQAMIEAQRFPTDFDGIIAGAPVYDELGDSPFFLDWNTRVNSAADGSTILTEDKLPLIHAAVLAKCDALDGIKDGLLIDPLQCRFDPAELACRPGQAAATCLTADQVAVARKFRDGARNSKGTQLYHGIPWGAEDQWVNYFGWVSPTGRQYNGAGYAITGYLGYGAGTPEGPAYRISDFDYDRDPPRLALAGQLYNPSNPDLSAFHDAGGKLILFHGMNDNNIPVEQSIGYYRKAVAANGGATRTSSFFRLFTPAGMNHCRDGDGGGDFDWLSALENWVERGQAPQQVIAYHLTKPYPSAPRSLEDYGAPYARMSRHPIDAASFDRARPVYPWPIAARYAGKGDPALPTSWRPARVPGS
ncbi:MAG: tannase/feruloyl esterase family alpha/beta hydrolase, partial [Sphingomicrobium sp.]